MSAVLFSDSPGKLLRLPYFSGKGAEEVQARAMKELKKALPSLEMVPQVYLDVQGCSASERRRLLSLVSSNPRVRFCIVDPSSAVDDVAAVFHAGAVDYLDKGLLSAPPGVKRRTAVLAYIKRLGGVGEEAADQGPADASVPPGDGWSEIEPNREHTFAFLFIEADDAEGLKLRHEPQNLAAAMGTFRDYVERIVAQHGGRLWMWSNFGGLALFPLHARAPQAPLCGLRILLSSIFYDFEESLLPGRLSFRMALSVGSTVYNERETGKIISDSVNSIFHLGRRFAQPSQFVLTADAVELLPSPPKPFFRPVGTYEGKRVYRMLRPSSVAGVREQGTADPPREDGHRSAARRAAGPR
ncbi:MAG TPA: hypothetical protein VFI08_15545 [Spirochaetia bacterium]|nr:hypothetical protein [Spirochaetia bacterium]